MTTPTLPATADATADTGRAAHYDVAVIGAGPGGTAAALRAAELGATVVLLEATDRLGGTCVNTGCVPTRVLAKTARLLRDIRAARDYGIHTSEPTLDWTETKARVRQRVDMVREVKHDLERFADAGVTLVQEGKARFEGPHTLRLDSGRDITAATIIVSVGGHSRRLPIPGADLATVPEHVLDLDELPRRVAIIGAGNTGAQLATIMNAFGAEVTVLDLAPRILMPSDAEVAGVITASFERQGIVVHTGIEGVGSLARRDDGAIDLAWTDSGDEHVEPFDVVVMATGWPADVEDLNLANAGVETERSSIPVDRYFRSIVPHIFAVGDANGRDMLVQAAQFEGEAAAENAVLDANRRTPHHLLPAGGFTDPDYAGVGLTEAQARERDEHCVVARAYYDHVERAVIDDREIGFLKLISDSRRELILGAHAVGENAVEVISSVTTAMAAGIDVATLANVKFAYPTYSSIIGAAARALQRT